MILDYAVDISLGQALHLNLINARRGLLLIIIVVVNYVL